MIKDSGCEKMVVGGAKISDKHCNFLVNTGYANSKDLETFLRDSKKFLMFIELNLAIVMKMNFLDHTEYPLNNTIY